MPILTKGYTMVFFFAILCLMLNLAISQNIDQCFDCIDEGGSWMDDNCNLNISQSCNTLRDFGCCQDSRCCSATEGCRMPTEIVGSLPCIKCRERTSNGGCLERYWTGGSTTSATPWYNAVTFSCSGAQLPKCAGCMDRDEKEIRQLGFSFLLEDCSKEICDKMPRQVDPCYSPHSCACFCSRVRTLSRSCPHLTGLPWE